MKLLLKFFLVSLVLIVIAGAAIGGGTLYTLHKYGQDLPDYRQLAVYEPDVMTRVHAGDGQLLAEFAIEKRAFVPIEAMPKRVIMHSCRQRIKIFTPIRGLISRVSPVRSSPT